MYTAGSISDVNPLQPIPGGVKCSYIVNDTMAHLVSMSGSIGSTVTGMTGSASAAPSAPSVTQTSSARRNNGIRSLLSLTIGFMALGALIA
jgi:hypothetical protein